MLETRHHSTNNQDTIFSDVINPQAEVYISRATPWSRGGKRVQGLKMPLALIGLVYPEARVKFKNIDFRTEADFACYCIQLDIT
jgi:hypothetical protein